MMWLLQQAQEHGAEPAGEGFDAGKVIIEHVSNSPIDHPLIHLPHLGGIDFSVTKHVFMLWFVAVLVFLVITLIVRSYLRKGPVPSGLGNGLEAIVEFIRDSIVQPNVGRKWVNTWTPLILTFFFFILFANAIGMVPIFDLLGLLNHTVIHADPESFLAKVVHGGTTAT